MGFQSYYIFANSSTAIHLGLRVDPHIRGKRLGMNFSERGDEEMCRLNPKVKTNTIIWSQENLLSTSSLRYEIHTSLTVSF